MMTTLSSEATNQGSWTPETLTSLWEIIPPLWPLKNLVAVNPLQGLEKLPFEEALKEGRALFENDEFPPMVATINRESIKWLKVFLDEGQAAISMPLRHLGFYHAWKEMAAWDDLLHGNDGIKKEWIATLPQTSEEAISVALERLQIPAADQHLFVTLMLTTLPGWAAYVKYRNLWSPQAAPSFQGAQDQNNPYPISLFDYLAVRLITTALLWPQASQLIPFFQEKRERLASKPSPFEQIESEEKKIHTLLLNKIAEERKEKGHQHEKVAPQAQWVFCIDVRSEPFRRALESTGAYETFGFAGFFGVPVEIETISSGDHYPSCPVLLQPAHRIIERPCCSSEECKSHEKGYQFLMFLKRCYQAVKYNFTTPFPLVETLGPINGVWMMLRTFIPHITGRFSKMLSSSIRHPVPIDVDLADIPLENQIEYAQRGLRLMGLTKEFAPLVVFAGHGSTTQNNAYATALDCGACGGRHGASNARVLATMLNTAEVRQALADNEKDPIVIPNETFFMAAEHNTTTDEVALYDHHVPALHQPALAVLHSDLEQARKINTEWRCRQMDDSATTSNSLTKTLSRSEDWAQARPEWGLARNSIFLIAPRALSSKIDLDGRSFLHSYRWEQDPEGVSLEVILTAPMIVTQWINCQYLFSSLDNVAYGGGSKITKNVVGKIGVMQGNTSDLMYGLPLQSIYKNDTERYHQPARLLTLVQAPRNRIDKIIAAHELLQKLFGNGWVKLACLDPEDHQEYILKQDLSWQLA